MYELLIWDKCSVVRQASLSFNSLLHVYHLEYIKFYTPWQNYLFGSVVISRSDLSKVLFRWTIDLHRVNHILPNKKPLNFTAIAELVLLSVHFFSRGLVCILSLLVLPWKCFSENFDVNQRKKLIYFRIRQSADLP